MLVFMEGCSEKIGSPNKNVEIDESNSVGLSTTGDTLSRVSGCLAVLNEGPAEHFFFVFRIEQLTH
jgi:hypothetical protein